MDPKSIEKVNAILLAGEPVLYTSSGIYKITCTANKKIYIGSALNLDARKRQHWNDLRANRRHNPYIQRAWNKYGEQTFTFEVLELVLPMSLTAREQYWLNKLKPFGKRGFNIAREAGSWLGNKHTPESIEKTRQANLGKKRSPESIEKSRQANLGRKPNPKQLEALDQGRKNRRGYKASPETCERIGKSKIGNQYHLGYKHTFETREKMRQAWIIRKEREARDDKRESRSS